MLDFLASICTSCGSAKTKSPPYCTHCASYNLSGFVVIHFLASKNLAYNAFAMAHTSEAKILNGTCTHNKKTRTSGASSSLPTKRGCCRLSFVKRTRYQCVREILQKKIINKPPARGVYISGTAAVGAPEKNEYSRVA